MADYLFTILDSPALPNFSFSFPRCSPQNPCTPFPALSFDNPRTGRRRKRRQLHLSLLCNNNQEPALAIPSSSNLDIVSSHEHSDGSITFRFGDPAEVAKDDVLEESSAKVEESKGDIRVVKVLDGNYAREVVVKRIDRKEGSQITNEAPDVSISSSRVTDEVSESCQKLLEDPKHVQLPVSASNAEIGIIEREGSQGSNQEADVVGSSVAVGCRSSSVTDGVSESSEKLLEDPKQVQLPLSASNTEVEKIQREEGSQGLNEAVVVPNSVVAIGRESSRVTDGMSESSGKKLEEAKYIQLPVSTSSAEAEKIETEEASQGSNEGVDVANLLMANGSGSSKVTDGISESSEKLLEDIKEVQLPPSVSSAKAGDSSSSVVDIENSKHDKENPSTVLMLEKSSELENSDTYGEVLQSISVKSDFDTKEGENNRDQENTEENFEVPDSCICTEGQTVESVLQNVPEDSSESHAVEVMPLSPRTEAEPILDKEVETDTIREFDGEDATEKLPTINNNLPKRILEEETSNNLQSSDLMGASVHELKELKSTDLEAEMSTKKSQINDLPELSDLELTDSKTSEVSLTRMQIPTSEFVLSSAAALLPHPSKVLTGGEDAYFIFQNWLGIADGVGQWSLEGTYPGDYAQDLMDNCGKVVSGSNRPILTTPEKVLSLSVAKSQSHGISTVLVSHFDGQVLHIANIGDSGFIILRDGAVHKRSSAMFHEFGFPIQIGRADDPSQLSRGYKVELEEGDIIVIATDGLFDNLYEQEIASIVSKSLEAAKGPKEIAEVLATRAQEMGSSASARSPFADAAQAAGYAGYTGGKLDDVTVIVSLVRKAA